MTNNDDKYQVASTDEYGIKTTKCGQKYLICHFIRDDFADKYAYQEVIKPKSELATSILLEKERNKGEYFYEPFIHRAIGYVVSDYNDLKGFSVENANTDKKGDEELTQNKQEHEFIKQLSDNLANFEPHNQYNLSDDYWKQLENAINEISENLTFAEKIKQIASQYSKLDIEKYTELVKNSENGAVLESLGLKASCHNCTSIKELKDIIKDENKINSVPANNQMNISGAKISSLIINMTNKIFRRVNWCGGGVKNSKKDRLYEIVKNINEIIDIQFNKLGHKSILVRDAESKKITKMELDKFVDYIKSECEKSGINIKTINKNFPTKEDVNKMINSMPLQTKEPNQIPPKKHGKWCCFKKCSSSSNNVSPSFHINTVSGYQFERNPDKNCNIF